MSDEEAIEHAIELTGAQDDPQRCKATSRATGKRCGRRPTQHEDFCPVHRRISREASIERRTHGQKSKYVKVEFLPAIWKRMEEMRSVKGKEDTLLQGAALVEARLNAIPDDPDYVGHYVAGRKSIREDLKTSVELAKLDAPVAAGTTIQVYAPGDIDERFRRFDARGEEGIVTIQLIDGEPWIYDSSVDGLFRSTKSIDKESGAEIYARKV